MGNFNRILNACAIMLLLFGVVMFFSSLDQYGINQNGQDAVAQTITSASPARNDMPLANQKQITALDKAGFDSLLADSSNQPVFMMIYASWCPHCKRMFQELNQLQATHGQSIRIVTISIDNREDAAKAFAESFNPLYLDTYIMKDGASYRAIGDVLRNFGLRFQGGISKSVGVPYNVVFYKGEPVAEIGGALPTENLKQVISDISRHAGTSGSL